MPKKDLLTTPADYVAKPPKKGKATGPGVFNGEPGYPARTPSPDAVDEKTRDEAPPLSKRKG